MNCFLQNFIQVFKDPIYIKLLCNWTDTDTLTRQWSKMKPPNTRIQCLLASDNKEPDYWVIINRPLNDAVFIPEKTIVFHMEPNTADWYSWYQYLPLLKVFSHETDYNNIEWHLSWSWIRLFKEPLPKKNKVLSAVVSTKYQDKGHRLRVDFLRFIDNNNILSIDIYGTDTTYKHYKGKLPHQCKDDGLFPYKYHFNAENNAIHNYVTEKLVDAILAECLCFYWGCPNIQDLIDPRAYIVLDLEQDPQVNLNIIHNAILNNEWERRLPFIKAAKQHVLKHMNFFNRVEDIVISKDNKN